jgi:hypothetical protein
MRIHLQTFRQRLMPSLASGARGSSFQRRLGQQTKIAQWVAKTVSFLAKIGRIILIKLTA